MSFKRLVDIEHPKVIGRLAVCWCACVWMHRRGELEDAYFERLFDIELPKVREGGSCAGHKSGQC